MDELLTIASVLLVILLVVTLVGHDIRVLLAKLFGSGRECAIAVRCPGCGAWLPGRTGGCPTCSWAASRSPEHRRQDALKSLFQQIIALERRGLLDDATKKRLSESVIAAQTTHDGWSGASGAPFTAPTGDVVAWPKPQSAAEAVPVAHVVPLLPPMPERGEEVSSQSPPADVGDRVRRYMERQLTHARDEDAGAAYGIVWTRLPCPDRRQREGAEPSAESLLATLVYVGVARAGPTSTRMGWGLLEHPQI